MITVIIPSYNREKTIGRAIESVLSQTYKDLELIVVDDCSTDNTEEAVRHYIEKDSRVSFIRLEKNGGACIARNRGIKEAKGEYIAFQDSDDAWFPEKLVKQLAAMEETGADVCFCRLRRHYADKDKVSFFPSLEKSGFLTHQQVSNLAMVSTQTIFAKRTVCNEILFDPKVRKLQDYDWSVRASKNYRFYYQNEVLVEQYFQNDSISMQGYQVIIDMRQYFLEKYSDESKENPEFRLYHLCKIAQLKSLIKADATKEYYEIYQMRKDARSYAKYLASKLGLMRIHYLIRGKK